MLKPSVFQSLNQHPSLFYPSSSPCMSSTSLPLGRAQTIGRRHSHIRCDVNAQKKDKGVLPPMATKTITSLKAVVTVKVTMGGRFAHMGITRGLDDIEDLLGKTLLLELVSTDLDPSKLNKTATQIVTLAI